MMERCSKLLYYRLVKRSTHAITAVLSTFTMSKTIEKLISRQKLVFYIECNSFQGEWIFKNTQKSNSVVCFGFGVVW